MEQLSNTSGRINAVEVLFKYVVTFFLWCWWFLTPDHDFWWLPKGILLMAPMLSGPRILWLALVYLFILVGGFVLVFSLFFFGVNAIAMVSLPFLNWSPGLGNENLKMLLCLSHSFLNECLRSPSMISWVCDIIVGAERGKKKEQAFIGHGLHASLIHLPLVSWPCLGEWRWMQVWAVDKQCAVFLNSEWWLC